MSTVEQRTKYPLSNNELETLLHTIEWLNAHLSDIIGLLRDRSEDEQLLRCAKSAHGHLELLLTHLQRHRASLGEEPESR
jgi:hypothetical protein